MLCISHLIRAVPQLDVVSRLHIGKVISGWDFCKGSMLSCLEALGGIKHEAHSDQPFAHADKVAKLPED